MTVYAVARLIASGGLFYGFVLGCTTFRHAMYRSEAGRWATGRFRGYKEI